MTMGPYYRGSSDSVGLYGSSSSFGGTYFEWFIFIESSIAPSTPTGGSWSFTTNTGTPPTGWSSTPPASPTNTVWVSIALVNSKNTNSLTWTVPGQMAKSGGSGTVTQVNGTGSVNGISLTGTVTSSGSLTLGGTLSNVNLATQVTGTLPINNGGTGQTTAQTAMNAFAGAVTSGSYLRGNGTNVVMSTIQATDVPTLNQNTTGTAANVTGIVAVANGGTGTTTPSLVAGTNVTISGTWPNQTINASGGGGGTVTSVATSGSVSGITLTGGPITTTGTIALGGTLAVTPSNFASQTANTFLAAPNGASGTPTFRTVVAADIPTLNQNTTGTSSNGAKAWVNFNGTGTVAIRASSGVSSITDNGVGNYTINLSPSLTDANYVMLLTTGDTTTPSASGAFTITAPTASAAKIFTYNDTFSNQDPNYAMAAFFR